MDKLFTEDEISNDTRDGISATIRGDIDDEEAG